MSSGVVDVSVRGSERDSSCSSLGQRRESHLKERGPGMELTLSFSSFFCNQVFFVYDPSSSTSLLSSVSSDQGGSVREVMVVMVRGPLQELTLGRLALVGVPTDGGDHGHHDG